MFFFSLTQVSEEKFTFYPPKLYKKKSFGGKITYPSSETLLFTTAAYHAVFCSSHLRL